MIKKIKNRLVKIVFPIAWDLAFKSQKNVYCTCCDQHYVTFLLGGVAHKRPNALCPGCNSLERDRLIWKFFNERTSIFKEPTKMLHVAPEKLFYQRLVDAKTIDYHPIARFGEDYPDKYPEGTQDQDLTDMPEKDNTYDFIYCSHVLEHIPDDAKAMSEMYRILKPGGKAVLQVPLDESRAETYEDFSITDPKERERLFGQDDHVRVYGRDYADRLRKSGFDLQIVTDAKEMSHDERIYYGFQKEDVYFCHKSKEH